jgi:hypothetical protein
MLEDSLARQDGCACEILQAKGDEMSQEIIYNKESG